MQNAPAYSENPNANRGDRFIPFRGTQDNNYKQEYALCCIETPEGKKYGSIAKRTPNS